MNRGMDFQQRDAARERAPGLRRKTLVVGLGATGVSAARFFSDAGVEVAVTDTRVRPPGYDEVVERYPDVGLFLGGFDPVAFERAEQLIVSPGVSVAEPLIAAARERGIPVLGDVEVFARHADAPVIAITGSNGKSTVTTLVGGMARRAGLHVCVGGNLGRPALDLLTAGPVDYYVLELSSFQLETTASLQCETACVLNVTEDHLDRYPGFQEYAAAKERIFKRARKAVLGFDDAACREMARRLPEEVALIGFGVAGDARYRLVDRQDGAWLMRGDRALLPAAEMKIPGRHNQLNALAAWAVGDAMGLSSAAMADELRGFAGLPHRAQWVGEKDGVVWINDSKGTNVGAAVAALSGMPGKKTILIAGGDGKGADFTPLKAAIRDHARAVVLLGRDASAIEAAMGGAAPVERARTLDEAVEAAQRCARPGDTVLFSPACASFDLFENYAARGDAFMAAVRGRLA